MACNCFNTLGEQMKNDLTRRHSSDIAEMDESGFDNQVFVLASGDYAPVAMNFKFRFYPRRKNGAVSSKRSIADHSVLMSYCPFCGTKFEGSSTTDK